MQTSATVNFNLVCCVLGGFASLFGLVSYLLKEGFYLTEALVSLNTGVFLSPYGLNVLRPLDYAQSPDALATITLCFTRLVLGIQLVIAGVQLPSKYLRTEWKSLAILLGPVMIAMWISTSTLIYAIIPGLSFLQALVVGACVTPTDPVLSNSIVKGRFANSYIPPQLQRIIVAESGANDGLGYIFLFLPLYIIKFSGKGGITYAGTSNAILSWFVETGLYTVGLSILYGAAVGYLAKEALHWADKRGLIDKESFMFFVVALALFIIGTVGIIDADDVLACFIAGNTFTWDDWFRIRTEEDSLQPIMDMLLNVAVFMWMGAVCPWDAFLSTKMLPFHRLVLLGASVLLLRRLPVVLALRGRIPQIENGRQALLIGFFGPIGVSAIFYLYISLEFLNDVHNNYPDRKDCLKLADTLLVAVWFLVISSVVVHGLSIPFTNLAITIRRGLQRNWAPQVWGNVPPTDGPTRRRNASNERSALLPEGSRR